MCVKPENAARGLHAASGFTLIELMMVIAIIGILATIATSTYRVYILKAQTAQTLVDYGQIRTTVALAAQVDGVTNLHKDSVPGTPPPALKDSLDSRVFNGRDGIKFQLVKAPAGTFASYPTADTYALIGTADNPAAVQRLRVLQNLLPHAAGDKIWVQASRDATSAQLTYPLDAAAGDELVAGGPSPGGGSGSANLPAPDGDMSPGDGGSTSGGQSGGSPGGGPQIGGGSSSGSSSGTPSDGSTSGGESSGGTGPGTGQPDGAQGGAGTTPTPPGSGSSSATGTGKKDSGSWTGSTKICVSGKDGKPLTGQNNTSVRYRVITPYANFQEDLKIDGATGCVDRDYGGLPLGGNIRIEVLQVVDYNPPNSGGTSSLWDGIKPTLDLASPK